MNSHSFSHRQIAHAFEFYLHQSLQKYRMKIMRQPYFMNTNEGDSLKLSIEFDGHQRIAQFIIISNGTLAKRYAISCVEYILWAFIEMYQHCSLTIFIGTHSEGVTLSCLLQFPAGPL